MLSQLDFVTLTKPPNSVSVMVAVQVFPVSCLMVKVMSPVSFPRQAMALLMRLGSSAVMFDEHAFLVVTKMLSVLVCFTVKFLSLLMD